MKKFNSYSLQLKKILKKTFLCIYNNDFRLEEMCIEVHAAL